MLIETAGGLINFLTRTRGGRNICFMVDDRLAGFDNLDGDSYVCPKCGHVRKALSPVPCKLCGVQMRLARR